MNIIRKELKAKKMMYERKAKRKRQLEAGISRKEDLLQDLFKHNLLKSELTTFYKKSIPSYYIGAEKKNFRALFTSEIQEENVEKNSPDLSTENKIEMYPVNKLTIQFDRMAKIKEKIREDLEYLTWIELELATLRQIIGDLKNVYNGNIQKNNVICKKILQEKDLSNLQKRKKLHLQQISS